MHRDELTLDEYATTVLRLVEAGMPIEAVARALGRREAWAQSMLGIARDPVARALIEAGRLSSVDAWDQFMALRPVERKNLLDGGQTVTGPRCEREKERAERAEAAKQCGLGLVAPRSAFRDVIEGVSVPKNWPIQKLENPPEESTPVQAIEERATEQVAQGQDLDDADEDDFPIRLSLNTCLKLVPQERELVEFYKQWDPQSPATCVDASAKLGRLQDKIVLAIVALLDGRPGAA
jgi:ParB family chromosome partitioning protein